MGLVNPFKCSIKNIGIVAKRSVTEKDAEYKKVISVLKKHRKNIYSNKGEEALSVEDIVGKCEFIIVLGGDGTILKIAAHMPKKKIMILGVNLGNLGFLSEITLKELEAAIEKICARKYKLDKRCLLKVSHYRNEKQINSFYALNEAVINQGSFARLIEIKIEVNQRKIISFKADGLIIATPTGSTAHSLSAGGPVVHPSINAIIFTPICSSNLSLRPLVMKDDKQITVKIATRRDEKNYIGLTIDGQKTLPLEYGDELKIKKADKNLYLIRLSGNRFFRALRVKLGWGNT
jgi:NAD+ kinase